jgi:hypothetical protein
VQAPVTPALLAQATNPAAAVVHIELWQELLYEAAGVAPNYPKPGAPVVPSPALTALEKEAQESPRWPGEDPVADAVLLYIHELQRFEMELAPALVEVLHTQAPRDVDLARADALWNEIMDTRVGGLNRSSQAIFDFAQANGVRMQTPQVTSPPPPSGAELPGGEMALPVNYRRIMASLHLSEVRGFCNQGVLVMNQAVSQSSSGGDLGGMEVLMATAQADLAEVPPWSGDGEFRDACSAVLESQARILGEEVPAMKKALSEGDSESFNSLGRDLSAELRSLQIDLHDAEANFRLRWGLEALEERVPEKDDPKRDQALLRLQHWTKLVGQAAVLGTQMRINVLLDGAEYEEQVKLASAELAALQAQAERPPPFDGEDTLRKPAIAVLDVLEQSFGDWRVEAAALVRTPKPREADQRRYQEIMEEERAAMDKARAEYRVAHKAFAEAQGIGLLSKQSLSALQPPSFVADLPGPEVKLSAQVRISFASGHQREVDRAFSAGLEAWNSFVSAPVADWEQRLPLTREVVAAAHREVLAIPPWMGQETLVMAAEAALSAWLEQLDKVVPRLVKLSAAERSQKNVDQYNKLLNELNVSAGEGVNGWNAAVSQWALDWHFAAFREHQEGMVSWARDSRALLNTP